MGVLFFCGQCPLPPSGREVDFCRKAKRRRERKGSGENALSLSLRCRSASSFVRGSLFDWTDMGFAVSLASLWEGGGFLPEGKKTEGEKRQRGKRPLPQSSLSLSQLPRQREPLTGRCGICSVPCLPLGGTFGRQKRGYCLSKFVQNIEIGI